MKFSSGCCFIAGSAATETRLNIELGMCATHLKYIRDKYHEIDMNISDLLKIRNFSNTCWVFQFSSMQEL